MGSSAYAPPTHTHLTPPPHTHKPMLEVRLHHEVQCIILDVHQVVINLNVLCVRVHPAAHSGSSSSQEVVAAAAVLRRL